MIQSLQEYGVGSAPKNDGVPLAGSSSFDIDLERIGPAALFRISKTSVRLSPGDSRCSALMGEMPK
jgi:hypothetical protein